MKLLEDELAGGWGMNESQRAWEVPRLNIFGGLSPTERDAVSARLNERICIRQ